MERTAGVGFFGLLTILFIGLKLTGYITWSWWWVLGPLWIPTAVFFGGMAVAAVMALMIAGAAAMFALLFSLIRR